MVLLFSVSSFAQKGESLWTKTTKERASQEKLLFRKSEPNKSEIYQLNLQGLKNGLANAPKRGASSAPSNVILSFPNANGTFSSYRIKEASVMHEDLQASYPNIRSYVGQGIENPAAIIRFSVTPQGLHTMTLNTGNGAEFIDPYTENGDSYIVYAKRDLPALDTSFECRFDDHSVIDEVDDFDIAAARNADDSTLRTFRLALACTIEYADFHVQAAGVGAGTDAQKKAAVLAAMNVTMTRVNGVYERDLSVTMNIIPNNEDIIFINSDSFDNNNAGTLINQSQTVIDANIGFGNYDIGHTFSTGGGGLAQLNSPCTANKARGITGLPNPVGDPYDIDFVAHELGHQYGAPHTFNGNTGNCNGNGTASNAYEPGSGTTIMAYAGICDPQNVQSNSDAYFHQKSLEMMWANISVGNSTCGAQTATGNATPTAEAGANYIIPISTPYMLTGSSTDADGTGTHTYTWEQWDLGTPGVPTETTATGPVVRSFEGTTNPTRYIPRLPDLLVTNGSTDWEKLVSINRDLNFQLTVRDNDPNGGQTASDLMTATVTNTAGPFVVTSQTTNTTWSQGNTETITWNVAGTNAGTVNTPNVDILLSTDGGLTYPTVLATAVPNDGSHDIIVPNMTADNCRVMVKGNGNIFFNINTARFAIGFNLSSGEVCTTYNFTLNQTLGTNATAFELFGGQNIPDSGIITDVNVNFDITSPNISQLHVAMLSPAGTRAYLFAAGASCAAGTDLQVTWDDEAANTVVCGSPTTGTARPVDTVTTPQPLSDIDGEEMNGDWTFMAANIGTTNMVLNTVDLEICQNGFVATAAPNRINQSTIQVGTLSTATVENTHIEVTSPNTAVAADIVYTLTVLPGKGTLYLSGAPLGMGGTFTQDDVNTNKVTYTTTATTDDTDFFRVDTNDSNGGTLPNLLVNIDILEALSIGESDFDEFKVFPNPTNGLIYIIISTNENVNLSLYDIRGRRVYGNDYDNNSGTFNQQVDFGNVASGIYMLNVESGGKKATRKLIIE